jgi:hypothetical protein
MIDKMNVYLGDVVTRTFQEGKSDSTGKYECL